MDRKFNKFKTKFISSLTQKTLSGDDYIQVKSKLMLDNTVRAVGITHNNYLSALQCAKAALSTLAPEYTKLPEDFVDRAILDFGFEIFIGDETPTDFAPLIKLFSKDNWGQYDIILHILNTELDEDFFKHPVFELYNQDYFYNNVLPLELKEIQDPQWRKDAKGIYYGITPPKAPYTICILKNISIYDTDSKIRERMIRSCIEDFFITTAAILKSNPRSLNLKECFHYSSDSFVLIPKHKRTISVSGRSSRFFALGANASLNPIKKILIPTETIERFSILYALPSAEKLLAKRVRRCLHWLGKSALDDDEADSFVQVSIALESLFTDSKEDIAKKLVIRCSRLLSAEKDDLTVLQKRIEHLYDIRSKILHRGEKSLTETDKIDFYKYAFQSVLNIINLLNKNGFKSDKELYKYLADKIQDL